MKKLYIDIRFAKCILALTAGWLMAGCSAEDELENGSATQQLSMTPMVNDLQTTRVKEEENLHEKTLSSLDFKMFEPTSSERRIDSLFDTPAENKAEELGSGDWKSTLHLDVNNTYPYYAVANVITAKPKAHAFKNEMCFPLTKTKCELKKHPSSKFECFFNDFNRTKTSLFLPFPSKLIQDNLVCVLELQE